MNLYETDFLQKLSNLMKEAFKFKKYKAMSPALAVFTGIFMLPIVAISFACAAALWCLGFAFAILTTPVKYLHQIVNTEGKEVKHATQAIVYLISWPVVFFLYVWMSVLLLLIFPTYAALSFFTYVWTLGGFKFHLFVNQTDDIAIEVKGTYNALPVAFVIVGAVLLILIPLIHGIALYIDMYEDYLERYYLAAMISLYARYVAAHSLFAILYSLIGFGPRPKTIPANEE